MATRITVKDLRQQIKIQNETLAISGSNYYFEEQGRNYCQNVDLYYVDRDGRHSCLRHVEGGSARECIDAVRNEGRKLHGERAFTHSSVEKPTRAMAKAVLSHVIDFSTDFHTLTSWQCEALNVWAKLTGYRKPQHASGSTGRYFFLHLVKKVNV